MELSTRDQIALDIPDADALLASSVENRMSSNSSISTKCCIFKTPSILFRHDRKAFVPDAFSIGPLHHGKRHLKDAEKIKLRYLQGLISRAPTEQTSLKNFMKEIRKVEREARECYALPIHYSVDEFVEILVLDGCFIIELLRKKYDEVPRDRDDPVFNISCTMQFIVHDLILLENQIPWLVLDCLFNMTMVQGCIPLPELAIRFVCLASKITPNINHWVDHGSKHMLDLLSNALVLSSELDERKWYGRWRLIPSATSLAEAGIKFKKGNSSSSILDIKFSNGVLEIPPLKIEETTGDAFRNLISFEQCYHECTDRITSYAILVDNLIATTKDLDMLRQLEIIDNWLNPEEAIRFLKELYHDTWIKDFFYAELCSQVNEYCQRRWPRWRALYVRNHFSSPWAIASQVVAGFLLLLTILQTIYTIKK